MRIAEDGSGKSVSSGRRIRLPSERTTYVPLVECKSRILAEPLAATVNSAWRLDMERVSSLTSKRGTPLSTSGRIGLRPISSCSDGRTLTCSQPSTFTNHRCDIR